MMENKEYIIRFGDWNSPYDPFIQRVLNDERIITDYQQDLTLDTDEKEELRLTTMIESPYQSLEELRAKYNELYNDAPITIRFENT